MITYYAAALPSDNISVETVSYSSSDITVYLILSSEGIGQGVVFNVSTDPPVQKPVVYNSSEVIQLTLLYNIVYNVSIESLTDPCGQSGASTLIQLKYSKQINFVHSHDHNYSNNLIDNNNNCY